MRVLRERRRSYAWKLRLYIDAIKEVEAMTDEAWIDQWVKHCTKDSVYWPRGIWLSILNRWALKEAERLSASQAA